MDRDHPESRKGRRKSSPLYAADDELIPVDPTRIEGPRIPAQGGSNPPAMGTYPSTAPEPVYAPSLQRHTRPRSAPGATPPELVTSNGNFHNPRDIVIPQGKRTSRRETKEKRKEPMEKRASPEPKRHPSRPLSHRPYVLAIIQEN